MDAEESEALSLHEEGGAESPPFSSSPSWSARMQAELLREVDPLGGMAHKDVYRDPALGYTPHYAPRDFSDGGGAIRYHHASMPNDFSSSSSSSFLLDPSLHGGLDGGVEDSHLSGRGLYQQQATKHRDFFEEEQRQWVERARRVRGVLRGLPESTERAHYAQYSSTPSSPAVGEGECRKGERRGEGERGSMPQGGQGSSSGTFFSPASHYCHSSSLDLMEVIRNETTGKLERTRRISSRHTMPPPLSATSSSSSSLVPSSSSSTTPLLLPLHSALTSEELSQHLTSQGEESADDSVAEYLHLVKGGRARERFDFSFLQRSSRLQFQGYDRDRWRAQREGTAYWAKRLPPLLPASSMTEAQKSIREAADIPSDTSIARQEFLQNTTAAEPAVGEGLTERTLAAMRRAKKNTKAFRKAKRDERFGLGRHGAALVQDGGPDQRTPVPRGQNDERLVDALHFGSDAYRSTAGDEHTNPYMYRDTQYGVGHLLRTAFDVDRRADLVAKGKVDPTERSMQHYGTPILQQMDEFVLRHRNARGERLMEYFQRFPHFRDQRLYTVYEDMEGFPFMRARPEFLEWELFARYRAHYEQRRRLALCHGLEPVGNETATEREARRLQLDLLCERTLFDEAQFHVREAEVERVPVETLRSWFGAYVLPSPTILQEVLQVPPGEQEKGCGGGGAFLSPPPPSPHLQPLTDPLGTPDTREPLLSSRYFHQLALMEGVQVRQQRGYVKELLGGGSGGGRNVSSLRSASSFSSEGGGRAASGNVGSGTTAPAPAPQIPYAVPDAMLRYLDANELALYHQYVAEEQGKQLKRWETMQMHRRLVPVLRTSSSESPPTSGSDGAERDTPLQVGSVVLAGTPVEVIDVEQVESGKHCTVTMDTVLVASGKREHHEEDPQKEEEEEDGKRGRYAIGGGQSITPVDRHPASSGTTTEAVDATTTRVRLEDGLYRPLWGTKRVVVPLVVRLESTGEEVRMTSEEWNRYSMEVPACGMYNHALDYGVGPYTYNRANYIETQDVLWEKHTASGREGWSPVTHADGLQPGIPVRARRPLHARMPPGATHGVERKKGSTEGWKGEHREEGVAHDREEATVPNALLPVGKSTILEDGTQSYGHTLSLSLQGEHARGEIVLYEPQPFFNPDPRRIWIRFRRPGAPTGRSLASSSLYSTTPAPIDPTRPCRRRLHWNLGGHDVRLDGEDEAGDVLEVPLEDVLIWQRRYHGPERTVPDETRRYNPAGLRRYIRHEAATDTGVRDSQSKANSAGEHFLDKYATPGTVLFSDRHARSLKQITELDQWTVHDTRRADNFRPLSISHRRDYVRQGYMPAYTPWEWISIQEGDQPVLRSTLRQDNVGESMMFSRYRHWRNKARPHGYLRHYDQEIRDFFQFVDGVVPWEKAQKIRTYWEVRGHHPVPQINRPEVAMHRNTAALLPAHMWVTDKKTGKVKGVKDSVRDYRTTSPLPKWVKL